MPDSSICREHTVIACPVCAKNGDGRGAIQSYYHSTKSDCLRCTFCGWLGNYETVQSYMFPCRIYKVVEMDLSVVENLLSMALQLEERIPIEMSYGIKTGDVLEYTIEGSNSVAGYCSIIHTLAGALGYLVTKAWLFPAIYKVEVDV